MVECNDETQGRGDVENVEVDVGGSGVDGASMNANGSYTEEFLAGGRTQRLVDALRGSWGS